MAVRNQQTLALTGSTARLSLPKFNRDEGASSKREDANTWFADQFPEAAERSGSAFLQTSFNDVDGLPRWLPVEMNVDFFAAALGGDKRMGHELSRLIITTVEGIRSRFAGLSLWHQSPFRSWSGIAVRPLSLHGDSGRIVFQRKQSSRTLATPNGLSRHGPEHSVNIQ